MGENKEVCECVCEGGAANARETENARVNRWDGGFDGLKRIREASGNKRGSWKGRQRRREVKQ